MNVPEPQHIKDDGNGTPLYEFIIDYPFGDSTFTTYIWAYDFQDAELRLAAIQRSGQVMGQIYASGPMPQVAH